MAKAMDAPGVYVAVNEHIPDLVKIGMSNTSVKDRMNSLSACTSSPGRFSCYYFVNTSKPTDLERLAHRELWRHRVNMKKEFFRIDPLQGATVVFACAKKLKIKSAPPDGVTPVLKGRSVVRKFVPGEYITTGYFETYADLSSGTVKWAEDNFFGDLLPHYILEPGKAGRRFLQNDVQIWKIEGRDAFGEFVAEEFRRGNAPFQIANRFLTRADIKKHEDAKFASRQARIKALHNK